MLLQLQAPLAGLPPLHDCTGDARDKRRLRLFRAEGLDMRRYARRERARARCLLRLAGAFCRLRNVSRKGQAVTDLDYEAIWQFAQEQAKRKAEQLYPLDNHVTH
jgi:hypothetical protein